MNKVLAMLVVVAVAGAATADLTQFNFGSGTAQDQGAPFDTWSLVVVQGVNTLVSDIVSGGAVVDTDLYGLSLAVAGVPASTKLPFQPAGTLATAFVNGDGTLAGSVFGLLVNKPGVTAIEDIVAGDWIGLTAANFTVNDLRPGGPGTPTGLPQSFDAGTVNADTVVTAIPEPATFGLMGVAALGLFLARKKARR